MTTIDHGISATVEAIDRRPRVGGPATSDFVPDSRFDGEVEDTAAHTAAGPDVLDGPNWRPVSLESFLEFCARERVAVDFVACHPYSTDWTLDGHGNRPQSRLSSLRSNGYGRPGVRLLSVGLVSTFADAEIHLTEWNSSSSSRDFTHDSLPAATYAGLRGRTDVRTQVSDDAR